MATAAFGPQTHPVCLGIIKEVGPVGVGLHVSELKQLPEAQLQDVLTDLGQKQDKRKERFAFYRRKMKE